MSAASEKGNSDGGAGALRWLGILQFYSFLHDEMGWELGQMIQFVQRLAASEDVGWMYPGTSHATLCLSTAGDYAEQRRRPMACVLYNADAHEFDLHFQKLAGTQEVRSIRVKEANVDDVLPPIRAWLRAGAA